MCIKGEDLARAEQYQETLNELGEALLKSADRENRLEYLKNLAARQKAAARGFRWKRGNDETYYLNMSDYYATMAKIAAVKKEIEDIDLAVTELEDGVMDCYIPPEKETLNDDPFADSDKPVDLGDGVADDRPEPADDAEKAAKAEPEIDDAS